MGFKNLGDAPQQAPTSSSTGGEGILAKGVKWLTGEASETIEGVKGLVDIATPAFKEGAEAIMSIPDSPTNKKIQKFGAKLDETAAKLPKALTSTPARMFLHDIFGADQYQGSINEKTGKVSMRVAPWTNKDVSKGEIDWIRERAKGLGLKKVGDTGRTSYDGAYKGTPSARRGRGISLKEAFDGVSSNDPATLTKFSSGSGTYTVDGRGHLMYTDTHDYNTYEDKDGKLVSPEEFDKNYNVFFELLRQPTNGLSYQDVRNIGFLLGSRGDTGTPIEYDLGPWVPVTAVAKSPRPKPRPDKKEGPPVAP